MAHAIGNGSEFLGAIQPVCGIINRPLVCWGIRFGGGGFARHRTGRGQGAKLLRPRDAQV